jgi:hypothetical protein
MAMKHIGEILRRISIALAALLISQGAPASGADMLPVLSPEQRRDWPAIGAVNPAGFKAKVSCTGTLIAPDLVLTAAHCVAAPGAMAGRSFVPGLELDRGLSHAVSRRILRHPAYDLVTGDARFRYDIALIELATPISPAQVPPLPVRDTVRSAPGPFGIIGYSRFRPYLLSGRLDCQRRNDAGADVLLLDCPVISGNSGAPVLAKGPDGWHVVAVVTATLQGDGGARSLAAVLPDWVLIEVAKANARHRASPPQTTGAQGNSYDQRKTRP